MNLSEMAFSWSNEGSMIWTSGSRVLGSWICATVAAASTTTGILCVIVVSRSRPAAKYPGSPSRIEGSANSSYSSLPSMPRVTSPLFRTSEFESVS